MLHLTSDDFGFLTDIVNVLKPVRSATKFLSLQNPRIGDNIPTFTSTIDEISRASMPARSTSLKHAHIDSMSSRLGMLLGTEETIPMLGCRKLSHVIPKEYVNVSYLVPRYFVPMDISFGYTVRAVSNEMEH